MIYGEYTEVAAAYGDSISSFSEVHCLDPSVQLPCLVQGGRWASRGACCRSFTDLATPYVETRLSHVQFVFGLVRGPSMSLSLCHFLGELKLQLHEQHSPGGHFLLVSDVRHDVIPYHVDW